MPEPKLLSAKEWAVEQIRLKLHTGELRPGDRISSELLAQALEISRTPVRDALWQLEREGLVTINARVGVFVRPISAAEIADIYRIKQALEPLMAEWAAERASAEECRRYLESVRELRTVADSGDVQRYIDQLEQCRAELLRLGRSAPMTDVVGAIDGRVRLLRFRNLSRLGLLTQSAEHHLTVARAIVEGDGERAHEAMRVHMAEVARRVEPMFFEQGSDEDQSSDGKAAGGARYG
jgi:DNA-binding GntR family transcriptional regulator